MRARSSRATARARKYPAVPQTHGRSGGHLPLELPLLCHGAQGRPSLLVGCTAVIKPSSIALATVMHFASLLTELDLPAGVVNFVTGGGSTLGETLSSSSMTDMVSLTGSVEAGQRIITASAQNITKVSLELGGKAPAIVCADADMDLAVKAVTASRTVLAGRVCNCAERLYVHESVADKLAEKLAAAFAAVRLGDPFDDPAPDMCSQISAEHL